MLKGALEENILTLLCWSDAHSPMLAMRLTPQIFSTRSYRDIAQTAFAHMERFSKPPKAHLRDLFEAQLRKGDEGKLLRMTLDAMEGLQADMQADYVLDELDKFIATRQLKMSLEEAADLLQADDLEGARQALWNRADPGSNAGMGIYLSDVKESLAFLEEKDEDYFPSGIDVLDELGVRPERKTLTLFIAPAKRGKTWYAVQAGKSAMLHRRKVLHITLEMSEKRIAQRYVQALYGMTSTRTQTVRVPVFKRDEAGRCHSVDFDTLSPELLNKEAKAKVAKKLRKLETRAALKIKEFPTGTLTIGQLNSYLDSLQKLEDFVPDLLIIDYPDLMAINSDNLRIDTGRTFSQIRGIAVARDMAVIALTQGNRTSSTSKTVGANQVAEDYSKIGTADTVLTYSQTSEERQLNLARLLVAAARNQDDQFIVLMSQSYATGQFCLDSVYMQKHIEAEVSRLTGADDAKED